MDEYKKKLLKNLAKLDFNYEEANMYSNRYKENRALHEEIIKQIRLASGPVRREMIKIYDTHSVIAMGYTIDWEFFFPGPKSFDDIPDFI